MPIYEYECLSCGIHFETKQSVQDEPIRRCPECSGYTRRVLHPVGIVFKGSGFYTTDNRVGASTPSDNGKGDRLGGDKSEAKAAVEKDDK
ncbi:MAG: zinc ribbon domain-containing protein [Chloroflexi bacterium]|nr:zinc ribbon domain-containing protein [Chloroflexota bacterium]MCL5076386.1 zinc ribbon domain-containing protein [Chloroflexota bacterium]